MPFVSVVIPTYNRAKFVTEAIDSVLGQTYTDYEIIVVDDGSTDDTKESLEPYMDKIYYIYQENAGASAARNRGIMEANGEWIALLDSDDVWLHEKLTVQIKDLAKSPRLCLHTTNATIYREHIGREVNVFDFTGFSKRSSKAYTVIDRPLICQVTYGIAWPQCTLIRRRTLLDIGLFDTRLPLRQDVDLLYHVALYGPWGLNRRELVRILRRDEATTNLSRQGVVDSISRCEEFVYIYSKLTDNSKLTKKEIDVVTSKLSQAYSALGFEQLKVGKKSNARCSLRRAFRVKRSVRTAIKYLISLLPVNTTLFFIEMWHNIKRRLRTIRGNN